MVSESRGINSFHFFHNTPLSEQYKQRLEDNLEENDKFVMTIIPLYWLTSLSITLYSDTYLLSFFGGALLTGTAWLAYRFFKGTKRRSILCLCLGLFGALLVHQQPGYIEPHFSFYASVYLLTRYKDITPLLIFLALTTLYYLLFTYFQSLGVVIFEMPVKVYTWGLWDACLFHLLAFYSSAVVFALIIKNHITDFKNNQLLAEELTKAKNGLNEKITHRTAQLAEKTENLKGMLNNLSEGLLMIDSDETIHPQYSLGLVKILETDDIQGRSVMEVVFSNTDLSPTTLSSMATGIETALGASKFVFNYNAHLLVHECTKKVSGIDKYLEFTWNPILNEDPALKENPILDEDPALKENPVLKENPIVERILLSINDVSVLKNLQNEAKIKNRLLQIINQILAVNEETFTTFISESKSLVEANRRIISEPGKKHPELINTLFHNMHTIKEHARVYGFLHITNCTHDAECEYDELRMQPNEAWKKNALLQSLNTTKNIIEEYEHIHHTKLGRNRTQDNAAILMANKAELEYLCHTLDTLDIKNAAELQKELTKVSYFLRTLGACPLEGILEPIISSLDMLALEIRKPTPEVSIDSQDIKLCIQVMPALKRVFTHIMRNSLDHGIEPPEVRRSKGKREQGYISCSVDLTHEYLLIRYRDDGQGLNLAKIEEKAIVNGLLAPFSGASQLALAELIFHSGFSTATQITEVSGRGEGLDTVKKILATHQGNIEIDLLSAVPDKEGFIPFEMMLKLPADLAFRQEALI